MNIFSKIKRYAFAAAAGITLAASFTSCESWIYNDEEDCVYYVRFVYDYNLKWANAFPSEVKSVTLYILDENDNVVLTKTESTEALAKEDYKMVIDDPKIVPGRYRLLAWAGDEEHQSFIKGEGPMKADQTRTLGSLPQADGTHLQEGPMDRLYHGSLPSSLNCPLAKEPANVKDGYCIFSEGYRDVFTIPMMKDTNNIRIVLQQQSGDIKGTDFTYTITDRNHAMDADNFLMDKTAVTYKPWAIFSGTADWMLQNPEYQYSFNTAVAEFTTSRLMVDNKDTAILNIKNHEGKDVVNLPVIQALLLAKSAYYSEGPGSRPNESGQYRHLTDQEWLDREDEYSLIFLLDQGGRWVSTQINILSWKVVFLPTEL